MSRLFYDVNKRERTQSCLKSKCFKSLKTFKDSLETVFNYFKTESLFGINQSWQEFKLTVTKLIILKVSDNKS